MNLIKETIMNEIAESEHRGHTYITQAELIDRCSKRAKNPPREILHKEIAELIRRKQLAQEGERIYLPQTKEYEDLAATALAKILSAAPLPPVQVPDKLTVGDMSLTNEQRNAVAFALNHRISLILGGAGCGKSTMIQAIIQNYPKGEGSIQLCSPTGKAAYNLRERTNIQGATTIHAAFGRTFEDKQKIFEKLVIVDEISMASLETLAWILTSIQPDCRLIFVGDSQQLPSVSCGNVVRDLLKLKVPSIRLKTCHRQSDRESALARNIRDFDYCRKLGDFYFGESFAFISLKSNYQIQRKICEIAEACYRNGENAQLLTRVSNNGDLSVDKLNELLQNALIPDKEMALYPLRDGDRVQITTNDRNQNVFNGQTGILHLLWAGEEDPQYQFVSGGQSAIYDTRKVMSYLKLAYALTVHKAQGSEFDTVIIPISRSFLSIVDRNYLYTAISRAKKKVILVGDPDALDAMLKTLPEQRNSALVEKTNALRYRRMAA